MRISGLANWRSLDQTLGTDCLRIASYNIHGCIGRDRRADIARIAQVIGETNCDVIGLQEVGSLAAPQRSLLPNLPPDSDTGQDHLPEAQCELLQLDALAQATGMTAIAGHTVVNPGAAFGNAVLSRHPVVAVRRHDFSYGRLEPRGALEVDIAVGVNTIRIFVTHLGLRPSERRFQVHRMLRLLRDIPVEDTVVVLGDINEWLPLGRPLRWLHGVLGRAPAERSFPAWLPLFALDRVWVRPRHALLAFCAHHSPAARSASDHLPVKAIVATALPPAAERKR